MSKQIKYKAGYKYQLHEGYEEQTSVFPEKDIIEDYLSLKTDGKLRMEKGYAWDGPTDPAIDTKNFMRGSLVHDALYQFMRANKLDRKWREQSDKELRRICLEDGMSRIRAWWVFKAVRNFGHKRSTHDMYKEVVTAP